MQDDALTVAWRLTQPGVPVNDRLQDQILEVCPHFFHHLIGEPQPRVVHREQDALHFEGRVELILHDFDGVEQLAQPLKRKIFALHRHHDTVGRRQGVQGQQAKAWGAVQHDEVVVVTHALERGAQFALALVRVHQLNLRAHQVKVGRKDVEVGGGRRDNGLANVEVA